MSDFKNAVSFIIDAADKNTEKMRLVSVSKLKSIENRELREFLKTLYKTNDFRRKLTATIINAVFKEHKASFLFSKRLLIELVSSDPNLKRSTLNGSEYSKLWAFLIGNKIFRASREHSGKERVGAILELSLPHLVSAFDSMVGVAFRQEQNKKCCDLFDSYVASLPLRLPDPSTLDNEDDGENEIIIDNDLSVSSSEKRGTDTQVLKSKSSLNTKAPPALSLTPPLVLGERSPRGGAPEDITRCFKAIDHRDSLPELLKHQLRAMYALIANEHCDSHDLLVDWFRSQWACRLPLTPGRWRTVQEIDERAYLSEHEPDGEDALLLDEDSEEPPYSSEAG